MGWRDFLEFSAAGVYHSRHNHDKLITEEQRARGQLAPKRKGDVEEGTLRFVLSAIRGVLGPNSLWSEEHVKILQDRDAVCIGMKLNPVGANSAEPQHTRPSDALNDLMYQAKLSNPKADYDAYIRKGVVNEADGWVYEYLDTAEVAKNLRKLGVKCDVISGEMNFAERILEALEQKGAQEGGIIGM